jgi:hypothetical protein
MHIICTIFVPNNQVMFSKIYLYISGDPKIIVCVFIFKGHQDA